jgi:hypothetical protein
MTVPDTTTRTNVVRPLRLIEAEIRVHLDAGDAAAREAAEPHYRRAAPLLREAKRDHFEGNTVGFFEWVMKKFGKSKTQTIRWIEYSRDEADKSFKSLHEVEYTPKSQGGMGHTPRAARSWTQPVDEIAERARKQAFRLAQEDALTRAQEREAERQLADRLIDIGYKVLAKELHPDKMRGDKSAFQRLGRVREKLRHCI